MRHERRASRGFTLIELLTVIVIIVLLVGILFPAISAVTQTAYNSRTQARIHELAAGAIAYKNDTGFYPGQTSAGEIGVPGLPGIKYTGSQILAWCLFNDVVIDDNGVSHPNSFTLGGYPSIRYDGQNRDLRFDRQPVPKPKYAPIKDGDLISHPGRSNSVIYNSISDRYGAGKALPILYYPSRLGNTGLGQYIIADNITYQNDYDGVKDDIRWVSVDYPDGDTDDDLDTHFWPYIMDRRFTDPSDTPYKTGEFILIGAGKDRLFGTADDLKNW